MDSQRFPNASPSRGGRVLDWPDRRGQADPPGPSGWRAGLRRVPAGIVAGAADLDPAAVMTAVVAGASFHYSIGWVVLACVPVLLTVFSVASRLGDESGRGLVELIRENHGRIAATTTASAMVAVNVVMIIADLRAVADALALILNISFLYFLAPVAFSVWWILMKGNSQRVIKALALIALAQLAYIVAAVMATSSPGALLRGIFMPHISPRPE